MIPIGQDWPESYIRAVIEIKTGKTLEEISIECGYKAHTLRNVFRMHWPKAEKIVSDATGFPPEVMWPSRFKKCAAIAPDSVLVA